MRWNLEMCKQCEENAKKCMAGFDGGCVGNTKKCKKKVKKSDAKREHRMNTVTRAPRRVESCFMLLLLCFWLLFLLNLCFSYYASDNDCSLENEAECLCGFYICSYILLSRCFFFAFLQFSQCFYVVFFCFSFAFAFPGRIF